MKSIVLFIAVVGFLLAGSTVSLAGNINLEKNLSAALGVSQKLAERALLKLEKGEAATEELEGLVKEAEEIKASHLLLLERQSAQAEKARGIGGKALQRHLEVVETCKARRAQGIDPAVFRGWHAICPDCPWNRPHFRVAGQSNTGSADQDTGQHHPTGKALLAVVKAVLCGGVVGERGRVLQQSMTSLPVRRHIRGRNGS